MSTEKGVCHSLVRIYELIFLNPKLRFIKSQYGAGCCINCGALLIATLIIVGFIIMLVETLESCVTTYYLSGTDQSGASELSTTDCNEVPKTVSDTYFLDLEGTWSSQGSFVAKNAIIKSVFTDFQATQDEYETYFQSFMDSFLDLKTRMSNSTVTDNLKAMSSYRNGSVTDAVSTSIYVDYKQLFRPDSGVALFKTTCSVDFSAWFDSQLTLDAGVYSYDRRIYSSAATTIDSNIITYKLTLVPIDDAYGTKQVVDGIFADGVNFFDFDLNTLNYTAYNNMPGEADSSLLRFDASSCPFGFSASTEAGATTCSLSFDVNVLVTIATINEGAAIAADELKSETLNRYLVRRFVTGEYAIKYGANYHISASGYLYTPTFEHFDSTCNTACSASSDYNSNCATNDYSLKLIPTGIYYDRLLDAFSTASHIVDCTMFSPFYLGPLSETTIAACTIDLASGCDMFFLGDGHCDYNNNNDCCFWDYGDCCAETCVSSSYNCGEYGYSCCETSPTCGGTCNYAADASCNYTDWLDLYSRKLLETEVDLTYDVDYVDDDDDVKKAAIGQGLARSRNGKWQPKGLVLLEKEERNKHTVEYRGSPTSMAAEESGKHTRQSSKEMMAEKMKNVLEGKSETAKQAIKNIRNGALFANTNDLSKISPEQRSSAGGQHLKTLANHLMDDGLDSSDNGRKLILYDIPLLYTTETTIGEFEASITNFDPYFPTTYKYGYLQLDRNFPSSIPQTNYVCYTKALADSQALCSSVCNRKYDSTVSQAYYEPNSKYIGQLVSSGTVSHDKDLGFILTDLGDAITPYGIIAPQALKFNTTNEVSTTQTVYVQGKVAVQSTSQSVNKPSETVLGFEFGSTIPCELAVCYCSERKKYNESDLELSLNVFSSSVYLNDQFFENPQRSLHCTDPFLDVIFPATDNTPFQLIENFYDCETETCPSWLSAFGSTFANISILNDVLMIVFIFFLTQFYLRCCGGVGVEDEAANDEDFEMELRKLVVESASKRRASLAKGSMEMS